MFTCKTCYFISDGEYSFVQAESDDSLDANRSSLATSRSAEGADGQQRTARKFGQTPASVLGGSRRSKRAGAKHFSADTCFKPCADVVMHCLCLAPALHALYPANSQGKCCTITEQVCLCQLSGQHLLGRQMPGALRMTYCAALRS